jgi:hypothetical protein
MIELAWPVGLHSELGMARTTAWARDTKEQKSLQGVGFASSGSRSSQR